MAVFLLWESPLPARLVGLAVDGVFSIPDVIMRLPSQVLGKLK